MSREWRTPREKKVQRRTKKETISLFSNISEFALQKVVLWNSCHGLSPLDIKPLNTNINKNEKYQFQRHYKSGELVAWWSNKLIHVWLNKRHYRYYLPSVIKGFTYCVWKVLWYIWMIQWMQQISYTEILQSSIPLYKVLSTNWKKLMTY